MTIPHPGAQNLAPAESIAAHHPPPPQRNRRNAAESRDHASETHPQSRPIETTPHRCRSQSAPRSNSHWSSPAPSREYPQTANAAAAHTAETHPATEPRAQHSPQCRCLPSFSPAQSAAPKSAAMLLLPRSAHTPHAPPPRPSPLPPVAFHNDACVRAIASPRLHSGSATPRTTTIRNPPCGTSKGSVCRCCLFIPRTIRLCPRRPSTPRRFARIPGSGACPQSTEAISDFSDDGLTDFGWTRPLSSG